MKRVSWFVGSSLVAAIALWTAVPAVAEDAAEAMMTPDRALSILAGLDGRWEGLDLGGEPVQVVYQVIGGGSMIVEILGPGHQKEMATVFAMSSNDLVATHFCASGNRTDMRFNAKLSTPDRLVFEYVSLNGVDLEVEPDTLYVHSMGISRPGGATDKNRMVHTQVHYIGRTELGPYSTELRRVE